MNTAAEGKIANLTKGLVRTLEKLAKRKCIITDEDLKSVEDANAEGMVIAIKSVEKTLESLKGNEKLFVTSKEKGSFNCVVGTVQSLIKQLETKPVQSEN